MDDDFQYTETDIEVAMHAAQKPFEDLIERKCSEHCGMRRAWPDGLCHATEQMCCLVPHSPIWAGKAPLLRPEPKVEQPDWDDL